MTFAAPVLRSGSELIDAALVFTKRYFVVILRAALPAIMVSFVVDVLFELLAPGTDSAGEMVIQLVTWGLAEGMAFAACWEIAHGNEPTPGRAWALVAPRLFAIVFGYTLKWVFILIGLVLLVVPGVYLIALYFAVPAASIAERASLRQAFRRSRALARPDIKRLMLTLGTFQVAVLIIVFAIVAAISGSSAQSLESLESSPLLLETFVGWALGILVLPLEAALTTLLYLDIRMRREGYDLQAALG